MGWLKLVKHKINLEVFDNLNIWSKNEGAKGLAYINFLKKKKDRKKRTYSKFFSDKAFQQILKKCMVSDEDAVFIKQRKMLLILRSSRQKLLTNLI